MKAVCSLLLLIAVSASTIYSQNTNKNKGEFIEYKNEYWEEISKSVKDFEKKDDKKKLSYKMSYEGINIPSFEDFTTIWHNPPVPQGSTGTCWCFCSTSMLESEVKRIHGTEIKLSEMFTVYWQYVEKARRFVSERGNSVFGEGAQANAVTQMWKKYGCVPVEVYSGLSEGQEHHNHSRMFAEMKEYLNNCKDMSMWNEETILNNIKSILNYYLGEPPANFNYNGKNYTPTTFLKDYVKINPDEYVDILSLLQPGYWNKVSYEVPDNWWHSQSYHNVPLDDYMKALTNAVKNGYSMAIGGDVSEAGYVSHKDAAMIPSFDIPSDYIDEYARQFRFSNKTTTDDHGIHIVGYYENGDNFWFLIKDSGSGSRNGKAKGYYFYHSDYIKLKMMSIFLHKSAVKDLLDKFQSEL